MKYIVASLVLLFSGCTISHKKIDKTGDSKYNILYNEGTLCLIKSKINELNVVYYPLNSKCKSSSLYSWKMNSINFKLNTNKLELETYSLYKKSNILLATRDCVGAGIRYKKILLSDKSADIYWGKFKILSPKSTSKRICFRKIGKKYSI